MSVTEVVLRELDSEFEVIVADMKPLFLTMTSTFDQQNIALWMKKLYDCSRNSVTEKKNRNMYAKALFEMVQRRILDDPFVEQPHPGPLPPLPSIMSNKIPYWLTEVLPEDLSFVDSAATTRLMPRDHLLCHQTLDDFRQNFEAFDSINGFAINSDRNKVQGALKFSAIDDVSFFTTDKLPKTTSSVFNEGMYSRNIDSLFPDTVYPVTLHEELMMPTAVREQMTDKIRNLERTFKEKILFLEGRHDSKVKEILDRKNSEIRTLDEESRKRCADVLKLRNLEILQLQELCSNLQKQIKNRDEEFKMLQERFHEEKLEIEHSLEQKHVQDMEQHREAVSKELKAVSEKKRKQEIEELIIELRKKDESCKSLEISKEDLSSQTRRLQAELTELKSRCSAKDVEMQMLKDAHSLEMKLLKQETESTIELQQQDNRKKLNQASDTIAGLEREAQQLRKDFECLDQQRQFDLLAKEKDNRRARQQMEEEVMLKVKSLQQQLHDQEENKSKTIRMLEQTLRDSEEEQNRLAEELAKNMQEMQTNIHENELRILQLSEDWKQEIEREKVKSKACKQKRLKQEVEFQHRLEDSARRHQQELAALTVRFEEDKSRLLQDFRHHEGQLRSEADTNVSHLQQVHQQEINALKMHVREAADMHSKLISSKDENLRQLCEEILQLGHTREEERKKIEQLHGQKINQLEMQLKDAHREHSIEVENLTEKNNRSFKKMENEWTVKIAKADHIVNDLKNNVDQLKEELKMQKTDYENRLMQAAERFQSEQQHFIQHNSSYVDELNKEIDELRLNIKKQDQLLAKQQVDEEEKITRLRRQYEEKLIGRMPLSTQKEMEETIAALKSQISSQKQILSLQSGASLPSWQHHPYNVDIISATSKDACP